MSDNAFGLVEQGMRLAQLRAAVLAEDTANARTPGFVARDVSPKLEVSPSGIRFATAMLVAEKPGEMGTIERAMGATAENAMRFRALAVQERAMLREFRSVAEDARR